MPDPRETPTETTAYQEAVELLRRVDGEHRFHDDSRFCQCGHPTEWVGRNYELQRRDHINKMKLDAFLARPGLALKVLEDAGAVERFGTLYEAKGWEGEWWVTDDPPEVAGEKFTLARVEPVYRATPRVSDPTEGP